jgi:hypothetical protein
MVPRERLEADQSQLAARAFEPITTAASVSAIVPNRGRAASQAEKVWLPLRGTFSWSIDN